MSKDAAYRLSALPDKEQTIIKKAYSNFKEPLAIFRPITQAERMKRLAGEKLSSFIVIETDAITFFPSVYSSIPGVLDFSVAMNRRLFFQGLWYPIISLNAEYIRKSSDRLLAFALEHEFEMNRIYQEISSKLNVSTKGEKQNIIGSAKENSTQRFTITQEELIEDERLMHQLPRTQPLLPKPYAESAMLLYLETNLPQMLPFGIKSLNADEEAFGKELYQEFQSWSNFTQKTYGLFVRETLYNLGDVNRGYV